MATTEASTTADGAASSTRARVLVIEDSPEFRLVVKTVLENAGHEVLMASDGTTGLQLAAANDPSVVILDLGLPDIDGLGVCEQLRSFTDAYVIMLTGRTAQEQKYEGLRAGADDYVSKPFDPKELLLRIEVLVRRPRVGSQQTEQALSVGDITIDRAAHRVLVAGREVSLTKIELSMLEALVANVGAAQSRNALALAVWGPHWVGDDHVINVHIANLRKKLEADEKKRILTVRGIGYRLEPAGSHG